MSMRKNLEKAYEITDAKIQFVSLVNKAANKRQFLLKKEDGGKATFTTYGRIVKADAENHYVTGIVYEPMAEDSQGNFMTEAEITKAAYWFAKNGDKVDLQHSFEALDGAAVVENWIAKADFEIEGETIQKGTWLMTVEVADENIWEGIEKGEITGFSMGGLGNYSEEDIELDNVSKQESSKKKGLIKQLAEALGLSVVEKGAVAELYEERSKGTLFWNAFNSLEEVLYQYDSITGRWQYETNEDKVRECLEDFNRIITSILTGKESITKTIQIDRPVEKTDGPDNKSKINKEDKEVTKQEVEQIVTAAISKAMGSDTQKSSLQEVQSSTEDVKKSEMKESTASTEITAESIEKMVEAAITKALEPQHEEQITAEQIQEMIFAAVEKAVSPVFKSKGLPSNLNDSSVEKSAGEEHYLHGIL